MPSAPSTSEMATMSSSPSSVQVNDAGVAQLLAVVVEDDTHAAVVEILVSAVQRAAPWIIFAPPAASKVNCSVPPYAARDSSISA